MSSAFRADGWRFDCPMGISNIIDISANITEVAWVNQAERNDSIKCRS